eukprot:CAMPEP_0185747118 /NCGR_PEP_ID=MMETSP1174-20130828/5773_1 /TAXON_ID=35687 /ORGANISM="Dictyocha speculum, Strain CCMP1381" /LENGTH=275 /DNA_ID=CAMNT_0028422165 /DNA_START=96 /DNA_END=923 /DNA_ORIENTATION=+
MAAHAFTSSPPRTGNVGPTYRRPKVGASGPLRAASSGDASVAGTGAQGVLFDIDGTLADSWRLGYEATKAVIGDDSLSQEEYHFGCRYTTPERLARHVGLEPGTETFATEGVRLGAQFDEMYIAQVSTDTAPLFDGMLPLLNAIGATEALRLGALTNAAVAYGEAVLRVNDLRPMFGTVHGADDVPRPKPFGDGLLLCAGELGLDASQCVYVGDAPSDGKAARAAGMRSIGVEWGSNVREVLEPEFDCVVATREELGEVLSQVLADTDFSGRLRG